MRLIRHGMNGFAVDVCAGRLLVGALALAAGLLAFGDASATHPGRSFDTSVEPAAPTEGDMVTITVSGELPHSCFDITSSYTREDYLISITVVGTETSNVCVTMVSSFSVSEEIGQLPAGEYTAEVFLDIPCCYPCEASHCYDAIGFTVTAKPDTDADGWPDADEAAIGTDPDDACGFTADPPPQSETWPPDLVESDSVNVSDVLALKPVFGSSSPPARMDIVPSGSINIADVLALKPVFGATCAP